MSDTTVTRTLSDRQSDAEEVGAQLALIQWIESARTTLHWIQEHRQLDPDLDARMRDRHILQALPWDKSESAGLHYLVDNVERLVGRLAV